MHFNPTELELLVMRALDTHPWYPPAAIVQAAGLPDGEVQRVRSALAELRRFELVVSDGRFGGRAGRYCLTSSGHAALIDTLRRRTLDLIAAAA